MINLAEKLKEFNEQQAVLDNIGINSRVLLVDSMNTYIRCFAATPTMNDDGEHVGGVTGYLKSIAVTIRQLKPTRVVCVFDGAGGSQRRRKLFEGYKDKRRSMEKLNRTYEFNTPDDEKKSLKWQLHLLVEILQHLPVTIFAVDNIEADDTIAYLTNLVQDRGGKVTILSTDKDFLQLISPTCEVYNPIKKKMYHENTVVEEYGIHPRNFLLYRILDGDTSDNIPGVRGIGKATFLKLFPYVNEDKQYTIEELLSTCKLYPKRVACNKMVEAYNNGQIELNSQLMDLGKVDISGVTKIKILERFDSPPNHLNKFALTRMLVEHKLHSAIGNFDEWILMSWIPLCRYSKEK